MAGIVFAAASFTDFLDGHLARKWNMVTDFGKFADPLADKLLTTVAFIYMLRDGVCSPVVLCIILAREFAVSGLRMVAAGAKDGKVIAANMWGKVKTVLQMLSIIFYFFGTALRGNSVDRFATVWSSLRPVLAGGRCDRYFRHQVPVGQPQLHQHCSKNVENQRPLHLTVQRPFDCVGRFGMRSAGAGGCCRGCSLLTPKENQKSASDFDALEPRKRGCSPLLTPKK